MVRIKVGSTLYEFKGTLTHNPSIKYLSSQVNPFEPTNPYQFGKYFQDQLDVNLICTKSEYETLFFAVAQADEFIIAWETPTGYQSRKIRKQLLPYPSKIMFFIDQVSFKLESEPYASLIKDMPNITRNTIWNVSTIANTNWS
jgi:hypothetical protein